MYLGELVKKYRTENQLSMDEFAAKSGLSKGYISMLENNKNPRTGNPIIPSLETLRQVASAIGKDVNEIINLLDDDQKISLNNLSEDACQKKKKNLRAVSRLEDSEISENEDAQITAFIEFLISQRKK